MITNAAVIAQVDAYLALVQANYDGKSYGSSDTQFTFENAGQKYSRIIASRKGFGDQRSVHAFVDNDGLLYKSAGWKAPVKDARWDLMSIESFEALSKVVSWSGGHLYVQKNVGQLPKGYTVADRPTLSAQIDYVLDSLDLVFPAAKRPAPKSRKRVAVAA